MMKRLISVVAALLVATSPALSADRAPPAQNLGGGTKVYGKISILPGFAPSSPSNGDLWSTGVGLYGRFGGRTFAVPGMDQNTGELYVPGGPVLGAYQSGKFISRPDAVQIQGSGSTGDVSGMSAVPSGLQNSATLGALFGDAVNARFYGVKCDGNVDDMAALSAAGASGKRVLFQPGVCPTASGFTLAVGTKFNCLVPRACEIRATAPISDHLIGGEGVSDVEVTGFNLNTQKAAFPSAQASVVSLNRVTPGARINISNNYVPGSTSGGLVVDNSATVAMNDNEVVDTYRDAIRCGTCDGVWALRNNIHDLPNLADGFRAIIIGSSKNAYANDNRIMNLRKSVGAEANFAFDFGGTAGFSISGNQISGVQSFVDLEQGSYRGIISGNTFAGLITSPSNNDTNAFGVYCINNGCSHIRVTGNDITGVYAPIRIEGGFSYVISGNDFHDFYGPGIQSVPVSGAGIYANANSPTGAVDAISVSGNVITNGSLAVYQAESGVDVQATTGAIVGNHIRGGNFLWALKDYNANANVETAHNLLGGGQSPDKFAGVANHRGFKQIYGNTAPNGAVAGNPGDTYYNRSGGAAATFWVKESGVGDNTGWVAK